MDTTPDGFPEDAIIGRFAAAQDARLRKGRPPAALEPALRFAGRLCDPAGLAAGVDAAANAATLASGSADGRGAYSRPRFADEAGRRAAWLEQGRKTTDFNDLHAAEGAAEVCAQWEDVCEAQGWNAPAGRGGGGAGAEASNGESGAGGAGDGVRVVCDLDEMLQRFVWVAGETNVFDRATRSVMSVFDTFLTFRFVGSAPPL